MILSSRGSLRNSETPTYREAMAVLKKITKTTIAMIAANETAVHAIRIIDFTEVSCEESQYSTLSFCIFQLSLLLVIKTNEIIN